MDELQRQLSVIEATSSELRDEYMKFMGGLAVATIVLRHRLQPQLRGDPANYQAINHFEHVLGSFHENMSHLMGCSHGSIDNALSQVRGELQARLGLNVHALNDPGVRVAVISMNDGRCVYCSVVLVDGDNFSIDHVVPKSAGGPDHLSNYLPCCKSCNSSKGDRHVLQTINRIVKGQPSLRIVGEGDR